MTKYIIGAVVLVVAVLAWAPWLGDDDGRPVFAAVQRAGVTFVENTTTPEGEVLCDGLGVDWRPFGRKVTACNGAWFVTFWKGVILLNEERPGWNQHSGEGFSMMIPEWFSETEAESPYIGTGELLAAWTAESSTYDAPNYSQHSWITVTASDMQEVACTGPASSQSFNHSQYINNVPFRVNAATEAAAGNRYERTLYRAYSDVYGKCFDIVTTLHSASDWNDVDMEAIEESQMDARNDLERAVQTTFRFE